MSIDRNRSVVARLFDEVMSQGRLEVLDEILAADIRTHTPVPGVEPTRDGFRRFLGVFLQAFPEQTTEVHALIAEGDLVAALHTHHVVHGGAFMGMPPSGRRASVQGIELFRLDDGRIVEMWHHDDLLGLLTQLGALPAPAAA